MQLIQHTTMMKSVIGILLIVIVAVATASSSKGEWRKESETNQRDAKFMFGLFGGNRCPTPFPICPRDCSIDPAVVHGFCCGCGGPFDFAPVRCPDWLQCPLRPEPLCSDYRFVMDCCCGAPFF